MVLLLSAQFRGPRLLLFLSYFLKPGKLCVCASEGHCSTN